ncbi:MAG: hypothetical protein IJS65_04265 [Clostridia bacterium]|nr:hypothetical protein [Clostridia bacterium]
MKHVTCYFDEVGKTIKPHHSLGNYPPRTLYAYRGAANEPDADNMRALYEEIAPPFTRLKASRWGGYGKACEICHIFRYPDKDVNDPENYYFPATTKNINTALDSGVSSIVYRLGVPRELYPPLYTDLTKKMSYDDIATVCANIVRNINDGWQHGTHAGIKYWEIWDRADESYSFKGTREDYYKLYAAVAKKLKELHPRIKVGGPSSSDCSDLSFTRGFLEYVKKHDLPLDFVTWEYNGEDVKEAAAQANAVKKLVLEMKLPKRVEIICTEWNCVTVNPDGRYSVPHARDIYGAAFDAAFMISMQKQNLDASIFYDCSIGAPWGSLVDSGSLAAYKTLYSFAYFAKLYKLKRSVKTTVSGRELYTLAATDGKRKALLIASCQDDAKTELEINGFPGKKKVYIMDGKRYPTLFCETSDDVVKVPVSGPSVIFVEG